MHSCTLAAHIHLQALLLLLPGSDNRASLRLWYSSWAGAQGTLKAPTGANNMSIIVGMQNVSKSALGLEQQLTMGLALFLISLTSALLLEMQILPRRQ